MVTTAWKTYVKSADLEKMSTKQLETFLRKAEKELAVIETKLAEIKQLCKVAKQLLATRQMKLDLEKIGHFMRNKDLNAAEVLEVLQTACRPEKAKETTATPERAAESTPQQMSSMCFPKKLFRAIRLTHP